MPVARTILLAGFLGLALAVSAATGAAPDGAAPEGTAPEGKPSSDERSDESNSGYGHLKPLLMEAEPLAPLPGKRRGGDSPAPADAAATPAVRVDPKTHTVRAPVHVTHARGVVEWLLSAGERHAETSVLLARCPVRALARALEQAGLAEGGPPQPVGEDAARPPAGPAVRLTLVFAGAEGAPTRLPAEDLLAAGSDGTALPPGRWVYVGPRTVADGQILLAELSGSLVTTALRDTSAMIYRVPASSPGKPLYVKAYYARPKAVPSEVTEAVLEIRPAAASSEPREPEPQT